MQGRAHNPGGWHCPHGAASGSRKAQLEQHAALVLHAEDLLRLGDGQRGDPEHAQTLRIRASPYQSSQVTPATQAF